MVYAWILIIAATLILAVLIGAYVVYYIAFARNDKRLSGDEEIPDTEYYTPYEEKVVENIRKLKTIEYEDVQINSYDGLKLYGRYYPYEDNAPVVIFFHGYRSSCVRDGSAMYKLGERKGINVLLVEQRSHGRSEGKAITFGIRERYDCESWVDYVVKRFGKEKKIVLWGVSMGAATVLMSADLDMPENVKGIVADCGFSSPKEIIQEVIRQMKFPVVPAYWLAKLGARIYGGFNLEETSAKEVLTNAKVPVFLVHGNADDFVPCSMSQINYDACVSDKELVIIEKAGHAMSYYVDMEQFVARSDAFLDKVLEMV